jgi:hypothetical protein
VRQQVQQQQHRQHPRQQCQQVVACSTSVLGHQQRRVARAARPRAGAPRERAGQLDLLQGALLLLQLLVVVLVSAATVLMLPRQLSALQLLALGRGSRQLLVLEPLVAG